MTIYGGFVSNVHSHCVYDISIDGIDKIPGVQGTTYVYDSVDLDTMEVVGTYEAVSFPCRIARLKVRGGDERRHPKSLVRAATYSVSTLFANHDNKVKVRINKIDDSGRLIVDIYCGKESVSKYLAESFPTMYSLS
uniref:Uncharacterized protein n=1 Tax=viral metagenome TaxID=1070528 RepID=A0A6C0JWC3_9ZZZZ